MLYNMSMSDNFSFEETKITTASSGPKGLVGLLINKMGVSNEATANLILIVSAIVIFAISGMIFYSALQ